MTRQPQLVVPFDPVAIKRLAWRCRRGVKELDLLLSRYLREQFPQATGADRAAFEQLLELPDPELARYLLAGDVPLDPQYAVLCRHISPMLA
jgi:antitoxin CptB